MSLGDTLEEYNRGVTTWLEQAKKQTAAVQRLQKAAATGNLRDLEKLRQAARSASETALQGAENCAPLEFDAAGYLADGGFLAELQDAARAAGVRLYERDGVIFCYPVLVRPEPELSAVRIDKRLVFTVRPETLAAELKKAQAKDPKMRPDRFVEALFEGYEYVRAKRRIGAYVDLPLVQIYRVLTLAPGADREYTLLDFTRDIYFMDTSDVKKTRKGSHYSLTAATASRERSNRMLAFVTRDGIEKVYSAIKFSPPG